jgi:hypothetical protein
MENNATELVQDTISWALESDGTGTANVGNLALVTRVPDEEGDSWSWEVSTAAGEWLADGPDFGEGGRDDEDLDDTGARLAAERWAMDWLHGVGRFDEGIELEIELGWLASFYSVRDQFDAAGEDPRRIIRIARAPGEQPQPVPGDHVMPDGLWSCACRAISDDFRWAPDNDAEGARLVDAWARHEEMVSVAQASTEAQAEAVKRHEDNQQTLAVVKAEFSEGSDVEPVVEPVEPPELPVPARKPDEVRSTTLMALVEFSQEQLLNLGRQLAEKTLRVAQQRADAREAARKAREILASLLDDAEDLATRCDRRGDMEPVVHRLELYFEEGVAVVRREDTGDVTHTRVLTDKERQGELPLEREMRKELAAGADADSSEGSDVEPVEPPFELAVGMDLASIDSGQRMRVMEDRGVDGEGVRRLTIQKLTKGGQLHGRAKPTEVSADGIYAAYRPVEAPGAPIIE